MKMAKASEADMNMAMELCSALDLLTQRWQPRMPEAIEVLAADDEYETFDRNDAEQCKRALGYLLKVASRASMMRVVWGMAVLLDPRNKIVNPDADCLEHHPETVVALAAMAAASAVCAG